MSVVDKVTMLNVADLTAVSEEIEEEMDAEVLGVGVTGKVFASAHPGRAIKLCKRFKPYVRFVEFAQESIP